MVTRTQAKWMRNDLPYGKYILKPGDGYVLFNRGYRPLVHVAEDGTRTEMERGTWVKFVRQEWFYDDRNPPWRSKATLQRIMAEIEGPATSGKGPAKGPATLGLNVPRTPPFSRREGGPALKGPA